MDRSPFQSPPESAASPAEPRERVPTAQEVLLFELTRSRPGARRPLLIAALALVALIAVVTFVDFDWSEVLVAIHRLDPWLLIPLMALLPLGGFSVSLVYLLAGARFGPVWGGVVVAGVTTVHLVGTWLLARGFLREPLRRFVARRQLRLPAVPRPDQPVVCAIAALVPGLPYAVRNYALALAGVGLGPLLVVCLPIYVARSFVVLLLGDAADDPGRVAWLLGLDLARAAGCGLLIWWLRLRYLARKRAAATG